MGTVPTPTVTDDVASLIELRRDLHAHPELRFAEHRTADLLAVRLRAAGFDVTTGIAKTGVLGTMDTGRPGGSVVLRADMDALPIADVKSVPYASTVAGVSHACGHDVHMAVAVGVAERLAARPPEGGRVSVLFQPAEEIPYGGSSGAQAVVDSGVFTRFPVDAFLALHCWPQLPSGVLGVDQRVAMAAKDAFEVAVTGRSAHVATPSQGRDAVLAVSYLVGALYQGLPRELDPHQVMAFNVGTLHAGSSQSILAGSAEITATIRTHAPDVRDRLRAAVERIAAGSTASFGLRHNVSWANQMPAVVNDASLVQRVVEVVRAEFGEDAVRVMPAPPLTTDDFALYGAVAPLLYLKLGVSEASAAPPLHSSSFDVDERSIGFGIGAIVALVRSLIQHPLREASR